MKNIYILLFVSICFSANAQFRIGAKAGISIPNLEGNSEQSKGYTSRQGTYGGLILNFKLARLLSLQPEINFSPQGGKRNGIQQVPSDAISGISFPPGINLYANFKNTTILNYLEVPVLLKFTLGHKLKYYACFGPHIAFLVEAKTKTSGSSLLYLDAAGTFPLKLNENQLPPVSFNNTTDIKESIKTVNAGMQGGLGLQYCVGRGSIFFEGRTVIGITNIQTHPETDGKNQTGSLAMAAGYLIKLK
jgi:hypothetical protein